MPGGRVEKGSRTRLRRAGVGLVAGAAAVVSSAVLVPQASAATQVVTFASISSVASGCTGARITGISESAGAKYYYRGKRLRFPTTMLPFDRLGQIELTAKAARGRTITQERGRLLAPDACFTDIHPASEPRYDPVVSWCTTDKTPVLEQEFQSESLDTITAAWKLTRRSDDKVVAKGTASIDLGVGPVSFPLPAGLPKGRYVLTVRDTASAKNLYPYSLPAEHYTCLEAPTAKPGQVTFRVPEGGPGVDLALSTPADPEVTVVRVRAGGSYTFRTAEPEVYWRAHPRGHHVGDLGGGVVEIPSS